MKKLSKQLFTLGSFLSFVIVLLLAFTTETKAAAYQSSDADYEYEADGSGVRIVKYTGITLQQLDEEEIRQLIEQNRTQTRTVHTQNESVTNYDTTQRQFTNVNAADQAVKICRINVNAAARNIREMALKTLKIRA